MTSQNEMPWVKANFDYHSSDADDPEIYCGECDRYCSEKSLGGLCRCCKDAQLAALEIEVTRLRAVEVDNDLTFKDLTMLFEKVKKERDELLAQLAKFTYCGDDSICYIDDVHETDDGLCRTVYHKEGE